ncbi:MAG TPA: hypothetical protein VG204_00225 [Terriglobia bacterium]|nr:hypothetical protein [Terriglobia bacterium]
MSKKLAALTAVAVIATSSMVLADFKYSETSQVTGGMMHGMMKFAGAFSKNARQANGPMESTIYVKGNRLRRDESMGKVHIIDLDGRRMIDMDTNQHTYTVMTFDQMRLAMQQAQAQAQAKLAEERTKHPTQQPPPNVKITPKVEVTPTGATRSILNLPAKETKMRLDMEMESEDPKAQGQKVNTWFTTDSWIAPDVPGYGEIREFYKRMAKELDFIPATMFGNASPMQMNPAAMSEFQKQSANMKGIPLLQYISMGMGAPGQMGANAGAQPQGGQAASSGQQQSQVKPTDMMMPQVAVAKALGGRLFGRKKKQQEESADNGQAGAASATPPPGASTAGSLMDMTVQVTSYSSDSLPGSLFDIPAGYTQVQANPNEALGTQKGRN